LPAGPEALDLALCCLDLGVTRCSSISAPRASEPSSDRVGDIASLKSSPPKEVCWWEGEL